MLGPDLLLDLEQLVSKVKGNLKESQYHPKMYADMELVELG